MVGWRPEEHRALTSTVARCRVAGPLCVGMRDVLMLAASHQTLHLCISCGYRGASGAGEVPAEVVRLEALETLNLSRNELSGELRRDVMAMAGCVGCTVGGGYACGV